MKQGWERKKLGEVCEILDSQRKPVTKKDRREGCYPYYGATGIQDYVDSYIFDGRYLLIGEDGAKWGAYDKTAFIVEGKCWVNNHAHILRMHSDVVDSFIEYYLLYKDLDEFITGAIVRKLTQQALRNIPIPVPPLPIQERIVEELDCISGIIEKKKEQLKELDALAQSIFYTMFGDPVENDKGWEVKKLGEVADFYNGTAHEGQISENGRYNVVNSKFISTNGVVRKYCDSQISPLFKNDIVMVMSDVPNGRALAKCYIIEQNDLYTLNQRICVFRNYNLDTIFLFYCLNRHPYYLSFDNGNSQTNLRKNDVLNCPIILPPLPLQQEFAKKIEAIEKQKELIRKSIGEVETLLASRMQEYFE